MNSCCVDRANIELAEEVILVDENDRSIGFETKLKAHLSGGKLHRAFSIFIFNAEGKMLMQRRSHKKYHFRGLWTNTCCSHPHWGEELKDSARKRLREEFGFDADLTEIFSFLYRAADADSGLTEHEFDHVFVGRFNGEPEPNPQEIDDWRWVGVAELRTDLENNPDKYTPWFKIVMSRLIEHLPGSPVRSA